MQQARWGGWVLIWLVGCMLWWSSGEPTASASSLNWTVPPAPPLLQNRNFECADGFVSGTNSIGDEILVPIGWTLILSDSAPIVSSTRRFYGKSCGTDEPVFIERLEGYDSLLVRSQDIETPPTPGKPFDVILYQQVPATYGGAYSLSAWMISLCGTKSRPFDCPPNNYIVKAIGIDPHGGTQPEAKDIEWVENRANFVDLDGRPVGWQNLSTSATALSSTITIFARMTSPFQFHGNMGFMDAFSLVRAPLSEMEALPAQIEGAGEIVLKWFGQQSTDIDNVPDGTHQLLFDVQWRKVPDGEWNDVVSSTTQVSTTFRAPCLDTSYEFRVRARAEQPPAPPDGAWPNHRYPGVWSKPQTVLFTAPELVPTPTVPITSTVPVTSIAPISVSLYLPMMEQNSRRSDVGC